MDMQPQSTGSNGALSAAPPRGDAVGGTPDKPTPIPPPHLFGEDGRDVDGTFLVTCADGSLMRAGPMALMPGDPPRWVQIYPSNVVLRLDSGGSATPVAQQEG